MKPITLQPHSLSVGLGIAILGFVAMGQTLVPSDACSRHRIEVEYRPLPQDMVQISEAVPYVVPEGKIFVLTALGGNEPDGSYTNLMVDGDTVLLAARMPVRGLGGGEAAGYGNATSMKQVPPGMTVHAGSTITMSDTNTGVNSFAWGYLAEAQ